MKRFLACLLAVIMVLSLAACGSQTENPTEAPAETGSPAGSESPAEEPAEPAEKVDINIAALKGPTAMGMLQLMDMAGKGEAPDNYNFTLAGSPDEIVGSIVNGEFDIAAVPTNLASVLYNKTEGAVQLLALNTLGVLYCVENGDTVNSVADLKGKTIYNLSKGSIPEYALNFLLESNGMDPETDVNVEYKTEASEVAALISGDKKGIAMLPQPFVTALMAKNPNVRVVFDFTDEWDKLAEGSTLTMGCLVVQKSFAQENPEAVQRFLEAYEKSVAFTNDEATRAEAAALAESYDIMAAAIAEKAIPECNIVYMVGDEMKTVAGGFLQVLFEANPASVGGNMPGDDFYYNAK